MLYDRIKELCESQGMSVAELERRAGLGNGTIGKWKTVSANLDSLAKVSTILNTTVSELLDGVEVTA